MDVWIANCVSLSIFSLVLNWLCGYYIVSCIWKAFTASLFLLFWSFLTINNTHNIIKTSTKFESSESYLFLRVNLYFVLFLWSCFPCVSLLCCAFSSPSPIWTCVAVPTSMLQKTNADKLAYIVDITITLMTWDHGRLWLQKSATDFVCLFLA